MKSWVVGIRDTSINWPDRCSCCYTEYPKKSYSVYSEESSFKLPLCHRCKEHIDHDSINTTGCVIVTLLVIGSPLGTYAGTQNIFISVSVAFIGLIILTLLGYGSMKKKAKEMSELEDQGCFHFMAPISYRRLYLKKEYRPVHLFALTGTGDKPDYYLDSPYWGSFLESNIDDVVFYGLADKEDISKKDLKELTYDQKKVLQRTIEEIREKNADLMNEQNPDRQTSVESFRKDPADEIQAGTERTEAGMEKGLAIESVSDKTPEKNPDLENQAANIADADPFYESRDIIPGPGQVFMMPLENGLNGACRVIRKGDPSKRKTSNIFDPREEGFLVMATTWVGSGLPDLSDSRLRKPLAKTFSEWNNEPEYIWTDKPLPDNFKYIGTIKPTQAELGIECREKVGWTWLPSIVLKQYEWDHEEHPKMIEEDGLPFDLDEFKDESLWYAAEGGKINVLKAAIKAGANPNAHNGTNTALMAAARYGHSEAARLLIEAGANPNIKNSGGDTALSWAENGSKVASMLEGITDQSKAISILQFPIMKQQD